jgi:hypothetical protein
MSDPDGEVLSRVVDAIERKDFFRSVLLSDTFDDWSLTRALGEFLVRIQPDSEVMGHALLARAYRHLGDLERAREELEQCRVRTLAQVLMPAEAELFLSFLAEEDKLLSRVQKTESDKP